MPKRTARNRSDAEVLIQPAVGRDLTKRDIKNYYTDPEVQRGLLENLRGSDILAVMKRSPSSDPIVRRYWKKDVPITINEPEDISKLVQQRITEFHPAVSKETNTVWVDVDAGESLGTPDLIPVTKKVVSELKKNPRYADVALSFSGGKGFHVRATLPTKENTTAAKRTLQSSLKGIAAEFDNVTLRPPGKSQIRLDVSTLHDKGSIRSPYSLNSETGLVAVPIRPEKLDSFTVEQATPGAVLNQLSGAEFAPGIPMSKRIYEIPSVTDKDIKHLTLAIQEHKAKRAGPHWDLRMVDPATGHAHSWALPKRKLPKPGERPVLAIQQPTHTARYALTFGEKGPQTIGKGYGAGTVEMKHKEPIRVLSSTPSKIKFERNSGTSRAEQYYMFKTRDTSWLLRNLTKEAAAVNTYFRQGALSIFEKLGVAVESDELSSLEQTTRLQHGDENQPVGLLAKALDEIDKPEQNKKPPIEGPIEPDMDQNIRWGNKQEVPAEFTRGYSPLLREYF